MPIESMNLSAQTRFHSIDALLGLSRVTETRSLLHPVTNARRDCGKCVDQMSRPHTPRTEEHRVQVPKNRDKKSSERKCQEYLLKKSFMLYVV